MASVSDAEPMLPPSAISIPLAVTLNEALEDNQSSEQFQSKMLKYFDEFELAPIPLFVNKWSESSKQKYRNHLLSC